MYFSCLILVHVSSKWSRLERRRRSASRGCCILTKECQKDEANNDSDGSEAIARELPSVAGTAHYA
jgi:hypothetical protein